MHAVLGVGAAHGHLLQDDLALDAGWNHAGFVASVSDRNIVVDARESPACERAALARVSSRDRRHVVDSSEMNDDLVLDMIAVLTSLYVRLYGQRSARNRALSIERAIARQA